MSKFMYFIRQHVFPGWYAGFVNRKFISKAYKSQQEFDVDISAVENDINKYIERIEKDLESQLDRKKRIEDKAKSLLFIIAVTVTAITFSLSYLKSLEIRSAQIISILILFVSILYLLFGAIRALQSLNTRQFHVIQTDIGVGDGRFVINERGDDFNYLKSIAKSRQANDLINLQLSNYTYASFHLIRNGIVLFVAFFMATILLSYQSVPEREKISGSHLINKKISVQINDSIRVDLPYSFEVAYDVKNLKLENK